MLDFQFFGGFVFAFSNIRTFLVDFDCFLIWVCAKYINCFSNCLCMRIKYVEFGSIDPSYYLGIWDCLSSIFFEVKL